VLYRALLYIHNYASAIFARHTSVSFRAFSNQSGRIIFTEELTEPSHVSKANEIEIFQRRIGWRIGPMTVLAIRQTCEPSVVGARACTSHTRMYLSFPTAYSSRSNLCSTDIHSRIRYTFNHECIQQLRTSMHVCSTMRTLMNICVLHVHTYDGTTPAWDMSLLQVLRQHDRDRGNSYCFYLLFACLR
jgi:hypothetical protein